MEKFTRSPKKTKYGGKDQMGCSWCCLMAGRYFLGYYMHSIARLCSPKRIFHNAFSSPPHSRANHFQCLYFFLRGSAGFFETLKLLWISACISSASTSTSTYHLICILSTTSPGWNPPPQGYECKLGQAP